jgi:predicted dehydrogenase
MKSKNNKKLRVAFIGGGISSVVGYSHKIAIEMDGKFQLVAGCFSRENQINIETSREWMLEGCKLYDSWLELLNNEKESVDVIIVLTPTTSHTQIIITAIEKGYFVVSEKALCPTSKEAKEIKNTLESYNGYLAVTYNYSGYPMYRELQSMIQLGSFGRINNIHIEMPQEGYAKVNKRGGRVSIPQPWRVKDCDVPILSLDLGVHVHQLIKALTYQVPISVVSQQNSFGKVPGVVDDISCLVNYSDGLVANIWYSKAAMGYKNGLKIRVFGEDGSAEWLQTEPEYLKITDKYGHTSCVDRSNQDLIVANQDRYNRFKPGHPSGFIEAFANYYADIYEEISCKKEGKNKLDSQVYGIDVAIEGLKMLEAISNSSHTEKWEKIEK